MSSKFNAKHTEFQAHKNIAEDASVRGIDRLKAVMSCLRTPDLGCPWDTQQSMQSLIPYTIEEAYEVAAAIAEGDENDIQGELGDLLFQVIFYAQITQEKNWYNFDDIAARAADKLIYRHPHVFSQSSSLESKATTVDEIKGQWEALKRQERANKEQDASVFADIPNNLPAMLRALKIQKRCASVGFDWDSTEPVMGKILEEVEEVREVVEQTESFENHERLQEELGDLLFAVVNLTRHLKVNPETALQLANQKFMNRFQYVEKAVRREEGDISKYSLEQLEEFWQEAKRKLKSD
ncbi:MULTISPECIES: nucleoside triphosphate pyrophosphohydrolase [Gammaproteobacteria]|uniref:nucleoside triphosphate pyrophosphohydrolase n=1 Tax=Gammaproteobacteria TaxID=1236 RepID=UPI000DD0D80B|nr:MULTISPECIES: nucleoside triphosphate pyrophosphohydrolase [Gammaproteobacteria]RTE87114.1 nucleoside triphosphate pyrophosphohydrolase [Aliidiomarina sp. B3213]TCZ93098.1 nucleoside triphosphate pyrophosphohydrolase [Lysobacter sp. N42]